MKNYAKKGKARNKGKKKKEKERKEKEKKKRERDRTIEKENRIAVSKRITVAPYPKM